MRITIDDIARMSGVSKATVSRVLNNKPEGVGPETRKRVQTVIEELDYKPNLLARGIVTSKTKTIGLIVPDITNPFFPQLIKAVESSAAESDYTVILGNTDFSIEKERNHISTFISKRVDGVILTTTAENAGDIHERLKKYNVPCVLLDRYVRQMDYGAGVFVDNEFAIFSACEHLIVHGNKKIAFISGPPELSTSRERMLGYTKALEKCKIPYNEELVWYGNYTLDSGYQAIEGLLNKRIEFTSVISSNDIMAIGALKALRKFGYQVPMDVEVIGFDNIEFADLVDPPLTTVEQPTYQMGQKATELLFQLIKGIEPVERIIRLQPNIIYRATTKYSAER